MGGLLESLEGPRGASWGPSGVAYRHPFLEGACTGSSLGLLGGRLESLEGPMGASWKPSGVAYKHPFLEDACTGSSLESFWAYECILVP